MPEYLRWGTSTWGAIWGVPPGRPTISGGGAVAVRATKHTSDAPHRSSGGGSLLLVGRKAARSTLAVRGGGSLTARGLAREHLTGSVDVSGGGGLTLKASVHVRSPTYVRGGGALAADGRKVTQTTVRVSGSGVLLAQGDAQEHITSSLHLSAGGTIHAAGLAQRRGSVSAYGGGSIASSGRKTAHVTLRVSIGGRIVSAASSGRRVNVQVTGGGATRSTVSKHTFFGFYTDDNTYFRWGISAWGAQWGVPPESLQILSGGGSSTVSAVRETDADAVVYGGGGVALDVRKHIASDVYLSVGGALHATGSVLLTAIGTAALSGGGAVAVKGQAQERAAGTMRVSGGGALVADGRKNIYWGFAGDDGTYFRWGWSEWGALWGLPSELPNSGSSGGGDLAAIGRKEVGRDVTISAGGFFVGAASKHGRGPSHISQGGRVIVVGIPVEFASGSLLLTGEGAVIVHGTASERAAGRVRTSGGGYVATRINKDVSGSAALHGEGSIYANGGKDVGSALSLSTGGVLVATGEALEHVVVRMRLSGGGRMVLAGSKHVRGQSVTSGSGNIKVAGNRFGFDIVVIYGGGEVLLVTTGPLWKHVVVDTASVKVVSHKQTGLMIESICPAPHERVIHEALHTEPIGDATALQIVEPLETEWERQRYHDRKPD